MASYKKKRPVRDEETSTGNGDSALALLGACVYCDIFHPVITVHAKKTAIRLDVARFILFTACPLSTAPVKSMSISTSKPSTHHVTLTCEAEGMYPEPEVSITLQHSETER